MELMIFALGCGVIFLCLAGVYSWVRGGVLEDPGIPATASEMAQD